MTAVTPLDELFEQMSDRRHSVRQAAEESLRKTTRRHRRDLIERLRQRQPHRHQRIILECLFQNPSPSLLDELAFMLDHPNHESRAEYAEQVAKSGKMYAVPLIEQFLGDDEPDVRLYATNGLSDRSEQSFSKIFARKVAGLLVQFIKDYPDDNAPWRYSALENFDPSRFANLEAELEEDDPVRRIVREAFDIGEKLKSHRRAIDALETHPPAYSYVYAMNFVDAEIRNGGVSQLYGNSAWVLILSAAEGAGAFGYRKLSQTLKEIVFYYHRKGRSKLKRRTPDGYFDNTKPAWNKSLATLEDEYYVCFQKLKADNVWDLWARALEKKPQLFQRADRED